MIHVQCSVVNLSSLSRSLAALVQPPVANSQEAVKDSPFAAMIPPTSTIPSSFMPSAIPGAGMFNHMSVQSQQAANEKAAQSADMLDAAAELTLQGQELFFS